MHGWRSEEPYAAPVLYAAQMNLAQQAMEAADMRAAREELLMLQQPGRARKTCAASSGATSGVCRTRMTRVATLEPISGSFTDLAFSPDGRTLAADGLAQRADTLGRGQPAT